MSGRSLVYYIGVSIDGFIAGPDDEIDFQPVSDESADALPTHIRQRLGIDPVPARRFDKVVMRRRTYDPALAEGVTSPYAHLRQLVVSRT